MEGPYPPAGYNNEFTNLPNNKFYQPDLQYSYDKSTSIPYVISSQSVMTPVVQPPFYNQIFDESSKVEKVIPNYTQFRGTASANNEIIRTNLNNEDIVTANPIINIQELTGYTGLRCSI